MDAELRGMVMTFRVTELQSLLSFAGKNKTGRKNELQARSLELVKGKSPPIVMKIKELYKSTQIQNLGQPLSGLTNSSSSTYVGASASMMANTRSYSASGYPIQDSAKLMQENSYGMRGAFGNFQRVITVDGQNRNIPLCPDVTLKRLPFYDISATLLRPTSLLSQGQSPKQEAQHSFCLAPSQAAEITNSREVITTQGEYQPTTKIQYTVQVQLRFCLMDSTEEQEDQFPPNLSVRVNGRPVQLPHAIPSNRPGVEPKRPSRPLNITNNVKCCPHSTNTIQVQWMADHSKSYTMSVFIVRRLTAEELLQRLKNKRIQPADFTRGRIKEITTTEEEDLCAPTSIRVTVACPLGKNRMTYPCRATTCKHLQCFDANAFLLMNEKKPSFICPVCNKQLKFDDLSIDGYFMDVIKNLSITLGNDIELYPDGSWTPAIKIKDEVENVGPPMKRLKADTNSASPNLNETIELDDDICVVEDVPGGNTKLTSSGKSDSKKAEPEIIDLLDSSSEDEQEPVQSVPERPTPADEEDTITPKQDEDEEEEEIGIRPRRRKTRINYVEESSSDSSSTNEGSAVTVPVSPQRPRSPACIELSDSPPSTPEARQSSSEQQKRAFASVSSSASRSTTHTNNTRSGSATSTSLYTSSGAGTAMPANIMGIGGNGGSFVHHNSSASSTPDYFSRSPYSSSSGLMAPSSSLLYPTQSAVPGYTAFDASGGWESDLSSFVNPGSYGQIDLTSTFDYFNSSAPQYDPRSAGSGGGYQRWM